jgi:uncharacterized coiled-coil protein SlyX
MSTLRTESDDEQTLETASRTIARWLGESIHFFSDAPKFKDPETLTALRLKETIQEYDSEIRRFKDILANRVQPHPAMGESQVESQSVMQSKLIEETRRKDKEIIQKGIEILEKRRSAYVGKLRLAKLKQFQICTITREADRINKEAHETLIKIEKLRTLIKEQTQKLTQLQAKHNELYERFQKINMDPEKSFPRLNMEIPRHITEFAKR